MKKYFISLLCAAVVFSMAVPSFAAETHQKPDASDGSSSFDLSDLGDALSDLFSSLSDSIPQVISSVEEALPDLVSGIRDAIDEGSAEAKDAIGSIAGQIGTITESGEDTIAGAVADDNGLEGDTKDTLQELIDHLSGTIGNAASEDTADPEDSTDTPADDAQDVPEMSGMTFGGWTVSTEYTDQLTDEEKEIFKKAETTLAGGAYTPVAVIAEQIVAGTNYAYLCLGAPDGSDNTASWYIVALYQDLEGNVSTLSIRNIALDAVEIISNIYNPAFVGAWTAKESESTEPVLPDKAQAAFEAATEGYTGVGYTPIALLGTQIVSGTNYKILCYGTLVTKDPVTSWYVLDIYEDLDGNCSVTDAQIFDLTDYISYGEEDLDTSEQDG